MNNFQDIVKVYIILKSASLCKCNDGYIDGINEGFFSILSVESRGAPSPCMSLGEESSQSSVCDDSQSKWDGPAFATFWRMWGNTGTFSGEKIFLLSQLLQKYFNFICCLKYSNILYGKQISMTKATKHTSFKGQNSGPVWYLFCISNSIKMCCTFQIKTNKPRPLQ